MILPSQERQYAPCLTPSPLRERVKASNVDELKVLPQDITAIQGLVRPSQNTPNTLSVPLQSTQDAMYSQQQELYPTPTFTNQQVNNYPRDFSQTSPSRFEIPQQSVTSQEDARERSIVQTPESIRKSVNADDSALMYKTPENERRKTEEEDKDESYFTPIDSNRKRYMYPNTPLAKIEEDSEDGSVLQNTANKMQQDLSYFSGSAIKNTEISSMRLSTSIDANRNTEWRCLNPPQTMRPDVRSEEDIIEPISNGATKIVKTTPRKFDNAYLAASPNKQNYIVSPRG